MRGLNVHHHILERMFVLFKICVAIALRVTFRELAGSEKPLLFKITCSPQEAQICKSSYCDTLFL
ncbi:uncharacterized protein PHALS_11444 [Plasmopara halstedii]|uniref:Uncharacterized protein n=1 Tax=Plasmopara halstedii TaxID=4781 RepID=A0A0P1A5C7_PLAHL|nr:uncharacterized protein PHALS_11444 [Plasmopara halstedii]CEG35570.1 hypothetical protein PHALS_11444 [Plasmopara halstedii]|eukprot:XP_024571939.1 hypothetical protein PHALS_11444 [Plasmopara halstedii]